MVTTSVESATQPTTFSPASRPSSDSMSRQSAGLGVKGRKSTGMGCTLLRIRGLRVVIELPGEGYLAEAVQMLLLMVFRCGI